MLFAFVFLVVALWGLAVAATMIVDPKNLVERSYQFSKRTSRIGRLKLGIFFFSEDITVYRIATAGIGILMAVGGTAIFLSLI